MKKILLSLILAGSVGLSVSASELQNIEYKNLKNKAHITYNAELDSWSNKVDKKAGNY